MDLPYPIYDDSAVGFYKTLNLTFANWLDYVSPFMFHPLGLRFEYV
jgi:hypothetical protein